MTRLFLTLVLTPILFVLPTLVAAQTKPSVQIGLSNETVGITSSFDGTEIVVFGSIENGEKERLKNGKYDLVISLEGPNDISTVRRKENKFGIWVNGLSEQFSDVPSSYTMAATRPVKEISSAENLKILEVGLDHLNLVPLGNDLSAEQVKLFRDSLVRLKINKGLYLVDIGGIEFLTPTLFKATLAVPANVPIGRHLAHAYLFDEGKFVASQFTELEVRKKGFEQQAYELAHNHGLIYGILAVLIAMATGWLASVIFKKD
jgi:uncharacterized protein (TIGR02186 family)